MSFRKRIIVAEPEMPEAAAKAIQEVSGGAELPSGCNIIHKARNTVATFDGEQLCVKSYAVPGFIKGIIYGHFRLPKARRAMRNGRRLRELGFDTPAPLASVEFRSLGLLKRSYYICRYYSGWSELRGVEKRSDFPTIARELALFVYSLHANGVYVKDLSQGNVLFRIFGGKYQFTLVDINRMEFDIEDRSLLMNNFRALLDTEEGMLTVAREYAMLTRPKEIEAVCAEARQIFREHHERIARKQRLKKLIKK